MDAFGLGPLRHPWEAKIETKTGRIYFINHNERNTSWTDPRLQFIPAPPYHIAITMPTAYFEDTGGSRWSSPVPSVKGFLLNRRGSSSPRLGGSPRIAPSPIAAPRNIRNEQVILETDRPFPVPGTSASAAAAAQASAALHHDEEASTSRSHASNLGSQPSNALLLNNHNASFEPVERPMSARSFTSSSYCGVGIPSSFLSNCDTETAFTTVCSLFPTAGDPHIRHLFHKYHNRATLVVSALQVEKHPFVSELAHQLDLKLSGKGDGDTDTIASIGEAKSIINSPFRGASSFTTGSPARTGTPVSLLKFSNNPSTTGSIHTRWGSPLLSMSPQLQMVKEENQIPKSPKMKLKYLKGIYPAADETFLLDVLASCENNVQKASEKMLKKGFTRTPPAKPARQKWFEVKCLIEKRQKALELQSVVNQHHIDMGEPVESPFPTPIMKAARPHLSCEEKEKVRLDLIKRFPNLPSRFLLWAAEAAKFELEKASRLLQEVGPETPDEFKPFVVSSPVNDAPSSLGRLGKDETEKRVVRFAETPATMEEVVTSVRSSAGMGILSLSEVIGTSEADTPDSGYFELEGRTRKKTFISSFFGIKSEKEKDYVTSSKVAKGPNSSYVKGPNPSLLQPNYVAVRGPSLLNKGPNINNRIGSSGNAHGPNPSLAKGPAWSNRKHNPNHTLQHVTVGG